ncbi:hypothetical protein HY449_04100 [Candidatus Pacearchaeota archaeon]|nr:hypothetical protein [Candidatus Pacearchaeota archaeon]
MKKAMTLILLSFLLMGIMINSFVVLADENDSGDSGSNNVATTIDDEAEIEDDSDEDQTRSGLTEFQRERLKEFNKEKLKKEFRENGNRVKVEREVETEDGKIKIKIKKEIIDANGNKREIKIEIEEEDGKRKVKVEGKEEFETDLNISSNESEIEAETSDGERHRIKILPDRAAQIARERIKAMNISNLTLEEIKERNVPRVVYNIQTNKNGRFLGVFKLAMKTETRIDPETGEVIDVNAPWWAFLVNEQDETIPPETNETTDAITDATTEMPVVNSTVNETEVVNASA